MRYLSQRFAMPNRIAMGTLNDIGTEELGHLEMVATIVHQLTRNLSMEEIEKSGSTRPAQKDIADNAVRGISDKEEARR